MAAFGAKYGIMISHFYWMGAIPAMVFVALLMMPFYYGSKARSVAEYLKLRFDEKTRSLNAVSLATITVFPLASLCTRWRCCSTFSSAGTSTSTSGYGHYRSFLNLVRRSHVGYLQ